MVQPPSSVSFITCGSKSSGTPFGSSDLSGCLRSFFACAPPMRKYPLSQYRSRDGIAHCCYQTLRIVFLVEPTRGPALGAGSGVSSSFSISPRLNLVPNERSIASLPDTRVSIQFVPFTLARSSSGGAFAKWGGWTGAQSRPKPQGAKCPHQGRGSHQSLIRATIAFGPSLLSVLTIPQAPTPALLSPTSSTPKGAVFEGWARPLPQFSRFPPVQSGDGSHSPASRPLFSI